MVRFVIYSIILLCSYVYPMEQAVALENDALQIKASFAYAHMHNLLTVNGDYLRFPFYPKSEVSHVNNRMIHVKFENGYELMEGAKQVTALDCQDNKNESLNDRLQDAFLKEIFGEYRMFQENQDLPINMCDLSDMIQDFCKFINSFQAETNDCQFDFSWLNNEERKYLITHYKKTQALYKELEKFVAQQYDATQQEQVLKKITHICELSRRNNINALKEKNKNNFAKYQIVTLKRAFMQEKTKLS